MVDDGQAVYVFACAPMKMFPLDRPRATSAAGLGWRRERSYKMAEQVARKKLKRHRRRASPPQGLLDDDGPRTWVQSTSGPLVQRCPIFVCCCLPWPQKIHWLFFVLRTEDAEAQDMRCRAQVVWWRTDGQVRTSVDSRMVTSRADPLAEACWHESKMTSALDVPCKLKNQGVC